MTSSLEWRDGRRVFLPLGLASAACIGLLAIHSLVRGSLEFGGLAENLALAWIPVLLGLAVYQGFRKGKPWSFLAPAGILWLLFLPNAPYIVTDFVHVRGSADGSALADAVLVTAFAVTGLTLGFVALFFVQNVVQQLAGRTTGWVFSLATIGLSGIGVYLGRIHRVNSWDALTDPTRPLALLGDRLLDPLAHPRFYGGVLAYTLALALIYVVLHRRGWLRVGGHAEIAGSRR